MSELFNDDGHFLADIDEFVKDLGNLKLNKDERQYVAAGAAIEAKNIIKEEASKVKNLDVKKLQLGKYEQSSVEGHLMDNVAMMNLHGQGGWNYDVGFINRTAKVIARFVNDGTYIQDSQPFMDIAKQKLKDSDKAIEYSQARAKNIYLKKLGKPQLPLPEQVRDKEETF